MNEKKETPIFDRIKDSISEEQIQRIEKYSRNEFPKFGYVLGILGLLLGIVGGYYLVQEIDYELGCMDLEFLEENYGEATQETVKECSDDYKRISSIATFLTYVSPILILFGILSTIYEYVKRR